MRQSSCQDSSRRMRLSPSPIGCNCSGLSSADPGRSSEQRCSDRTGSRSCIDSGAHKGIATARGDCGQTRRLDGGQTGSRPARDRNVGAVGDPDGVRGWLPVTAWPVWGLPARPSLPRFAAFCRAAASCYLSKNNADRGLTAPHSRSHNTEVAGSNPVPAIERNMGTLSPLGLGVVDVEWALGVSGVAGVAARTSHARGDPARACRGWERMAELIGLRAASAAVPDTGEGASQQSGAAGGLCGARGRRL